MAADRKRRRNPVEVKMYFSDYFDVDPAIIKAYGALNITLLNDLPLFIDPFLLFASKKQKYQQLHDDIIEYLKFLRDKATARKYTRGDLKAWYMFPEVKQLWLGFSLKGNGGSGLGNDFAQALSRNLEAIFSDFGNEKLTEGTHMEKVCLVADGVGKDCVSDFTANLIKSYLCEYTQTFARDHVSARQRAMVMVDKAYFDYELESWMPAEFELPIHESDYVLLTPRDILSREENWINRPELVDGLQRVALASEDMALRTKLDNYLQKRLKEKMGDKERREIFKRALREFPAIIEHYIRQKEKRKEEAIKQSALKVEDSEAFYIEGFRELAQQLLLQSDFYQQNCDTLEEARERVMFLKHVIEDCGGYRLFYHKDKPIQRESDLQILYKLTWFATISDFNSEVNNGSGPVDFKISRGRSDASLVEFKLAKNTKLEKNLKAQVETYKKANNTDKALKVIFYFSDEQLARVQTILFDLKLNSNPDVILVDVRNDNKPSGSKA